MGTFFGILFSVSVLILCVFLYHKTWSPFFCEECRSVFTFTFEEESEDTHLRGVVHVNETSKCWSKKCGYKKVISTREEPKKRKGGVI